ncbi:MAG: SBBP repeat-containing protein [bacterium]
MLKKILFVIVLGLTLGILSFSVADDLVYSTYLGGMSYDEGIAIAVDTAGYAYAAGATMSYDFPTTTGAYNSNGSSDEVYVVKFNLDGTGLVYAAQIGGTYSEYPTGIVLDSDDNAYITGVTGSSNYPTTAGAFDTSFNNSYGYYDAFVTKLNASGTALVYSTFVGGTTDDHGHSIALDNSGNAYITGMTKSTDFPTTAGAYDTSYNGNYVGHCNVFVTKLNSTGSALIYSTYVGSLYHDEGNDIAVDQTGNAYVTGITSSPLFPVTSGAFQTTYTDGTPDGYDAFVFKLNSSGSGLTYSTYLGGTGGTDNGTGIAVDASGNAYITGLTYSRDFPTTPGALSTTLNQDTSISSTDDAFITKLNPTGTALVYSTFLGGNGLDFGDRIVIDASGNAYVTGQTRSTNFPVTHSGYDQSYNGGSASAYAGDVFVTRLNATGSAVVCSTYLGGNKTDSGSGIALDNAGNAYITGYTQSTTFPTTIGTFQRAFNMFGTTHAFVSKLVIDNSPLAVEEAIWKSYNNLDIIDIQKR